jgi:hypothetical protein
VGDTYIVIVHRILLSGSCFVGKYSQMKSCSIRFNLICRSRLVKVSRDTRLEYSRILV